MPYPDTLLKGYQVLNNPEESLRRQIQVLLSSYNSAWDPLTELIQNAVDAINTRARSENGAYRGKIAITINSTAGTLDIEDNGIGMPKGSANTILLPSGTLKTGGNTYGHKGLGFTYAAHLADKVVVSTEHMGVADDWEFTGGFQWVNDPTASTQLNSPPANYTRLKKMNGPGTAIRVRFATGQYEVNIANTAVFDSFFDWADDENLLSFVLRTRTAIGQVHDLFGTQPIVDIDIEVYLVNSGKRFTVPYRFFEFWNYPPLSHQHDQQASDYATNVYLNPRVPNKVHFGIYHLFSQNMDNPAEPLRVGKNRGGIQFKAWVYACGKENMSKALESYDPRLTTSFRYLAMSTGVFLGIDGMINGVPMDNWDNYGHHEDRFFCIINTELRFGTVLDAGRKTITRHYVDLLVDGVITMTKDKRYFGGQASFHEMSAQMQSKPVVVGQGRMPIDYINKWETKRPLLDGSLLFRRLADDELAAYLLFGELVGAGHLPGYRFKYVSAAAVYDGTLELEIDLNNLYNRNSTAGGTAKLGVGQALVQQNGGQFSKYKWQDPASGQTHLVVEFKVAAEDLLKDVQSRKTDKDFRHIHLLVCLQCNVDEIKRLTGAINTVKDINRVFPGVTHELHYAGHTVQVISLQDALSRLSQP